MQELGTWVSRTHMEEPRKKRRLLAIPEVGEKQGERNILLCYPFAVHRSKVLFKKTFFFFFSEMLYADGKHLGCCVNPDNKKAEMSPKLCTKKVQIK